MKATIKYSNCHKDKAEWVLKLIRLFTYSKRRYSQTGARVCFCFNNVYCNADIIVL